MTDRLASTTDITPGLQRGRAEVEVYEHEKATAPCNGLAKKTGDQK